MSFDIGFDDQTPSLPQGGGSLSGLGETFTPDLSTGTGSFEIKLDCPNGPNDVGPRLSLRYDTGAANGAFGMGFSVPLPRVLRSVAQGFPRYQPGDKFMLGGAGELLNLGGGIFRPEVDGGAWRISASGDGFQLSDRESNLYFAGTTPETRLFDSASGLSGAANTFAWHLEHIEDPLGNAAVFTWMRDQNQLYLASVVWGVYELDFHYTTRPDLIRYGRSGFPITTALRCDRIELRLPSDAQPLLRQWALTYQQDPANGCSELIEVQLSGFDEGGVRLDAPPLKLGYSAFQLRDLERFENADDTAPPPRLEQPDRRIELIDWNGDGLPDLIEVAAGGRARVWPNLGELTWGRPQIVANLPYFASPSTSMVFADMNGDGFADLFRIDSDFEGYVPRVAGDGFAQPVFWRQSPAASLQSPDSRLVDLDGDGIPDLLASSEDFLALYYRKDPDGWSARPQLVPRSIVPDINLADPHIFLADMTGDGTDDLVRVTGGDVTYWPYFGLGRWGEPVTMLNGPDLPFDVDPRRLFLTDIDGDGCADLVCLDSGRALYWINQSGNSFSGQHEINYVPTGQINSVRLADMRGSGTAGLLWSNFGAFERGSVYFYLDFSGSSKPYLLSALDNGLGLTTTITYGTSAEEAAIDARAGQPWATTLPVAVNVVRSISSTDAATGRVTSSSFRYHNGRFDGVLREFAGFARVDADAIGDATAPTLRATTSFHVGLDPNTFAEPATEEERHRLRALRGRILRQDQFGIDGSPQENSPFDRLEQQWSVAFEDTTGGRIYVPRLVTSTRSVFERTATAAATVTSTNAAFDAVGNITDSTQTTEVAGQPLLTRAVRSITSFAADPTGRFISRPWRVQQFDQNGAILADTVTEYDNTTRGTVGAQGLVTKRSALVLTDAMAASVYGAVLPDFASLGYRRDVLAAGWWIDIATYQRTDDATGLHGQVTGPLGAVATFDFDINKTYPVRITDTFGNTITAVPNYRVSRIQQIVDASGQTHAAAYDPLARTTANIEPGDDDALPTAQFEYELGSLPVSRIVHVRAESGLAATMDERSLYDSTGLLLERRVRDEAGEITVAQHLYSARGLVARSFTESRPASAAFVLPAPAQPHAEFTYDALGRLIQQINPDTSIRRFIYRPLLVEEADEEDTRTGPGAQHTGTPTRRHVDPTGRVLVIEENLQGTLISTSYVYDAKGQLLTHTDALGITSTFDYDLLGRTLRVNRPERGGTAVLDAAGNIVESRNRDGTVVLNEFDLGSRPVAVRFDTAASPPIVTYTYHDAGRPAPPDAGLHTTGGRCVRVDDEGGSTIFDYDERGRVALRRSLPAGLAQSFQMDFRYRPDNQFAEITYPDTGGGRLAVSYLYNSRGLLTSVPSVASKIQYDLAGRQTQIDFANGTTEKSAFDPLMGKLSSLELTGPSGSLRLNQYTLDLVGNLVKIDSPDPQQTFTYTFDDLYRLAHAQSGSGEIWTAAYDTAGNITSKSDVGDYHYGEGGAAPNSLTSAGVSSFTYTAQGEMLTTPWGVQTFNPLGRLTRIDLPGGAGSLSFVYDYQGRRVTARSTGLATAVDRLTPEPYFSIEFGTVVLHFLIRDRVVAQEPAGGARVYLHGDHLHSLVAVTDTAGALIDALRYDPWGQLLERTGAASPVPAGFTGGVPEPSVDLVYLGARYYHPRFGRFISPDCYVGDLLSPIAWNPYVYCRDNPVTYVDPGGHNFLAIFLSIVAIVALVVVMIFVPVSAPVLVPVIIGIVSGGVVGAVSAYISGARGWDIVSAALVGAAVGGWAAYGGAVVSSAAFSAVAGGAHTLAADIAAGAVNGAFNGAAMGLASGAGDQRGSLTDTLIRTFAGLLAGAAVGAGLGALAHLSFDSSSQPKFEQGYYKTDPSQVPNMPPSERGGLYSTGSGSFFQPQPSHDPLDLAPQAALEVVKRTAGDPTLADAATASIFTKVPLQTFVIDLTVGAAELLAKTALDAWHIYVIDQAAQGREAKIGPVKAPPIKWG
jgi:RHS repeat-associated protein